MEDASSRNPSLASSPEAEAILQESSLTSDSHFEPRRDELKVIISDAGRRSVDGGVSDVSRGHPFSLLDNLLQNPNYGTAMPPPQPSQRHARVSHAAKDKDNTRVRKTKKAKLEISRGIASSSSQPSSATETPIQDVFKCDGCELKFADLLTCARHRMWTFHSQNKRKPITAGVIMTEDGKYECQFCHKVYDSLSSYRGHIPLHFRRTVKGSEVTAKPIVEPPSYRL